MKAMGYAQRVLTKLSLSGNTLSATAKNNGKDETDTVDLSGLSVAYASSAGNSSNLGEVPADRYAKKSDLNKYAGYSVLNVNSYKSESSGAIASVYPAGIWHKFSAVTIKPGVNFLGTSRAIGNFSILSGSGSWSSGSNAYALCINLGTTSYNRYYLTISASSSDFSAQYFIPFFAHGVPLEIQRLN